MTLQIQIERISASDERLPSPGSIIRRFQSTVSDTTLDIESQLEWEKMQEGFERDKDILADFDDRLDEKRGTGRETRSGKKPINSDWLEKHD